MNRRLRAAVLAIAALLAIDVSGARAQSPSPTPASADDAVPDQYVRGQVLTIGHGFVVFTTGDALRLRTGTVAPKGTTVGSLVRVTIDQLAREIKAIELEPRTTLAGEVDITSLGRHYAVRSTGSVPKPESTDTPAATSATSSESVTVTLFVSVPANTPVGDDVYLSTGRSAFSPSEIRMDQVDARHFTTKLSLPSGSRLRYQFTRGTNASVERERSGDIARPHDFVAVAGKRIEDTVARWADLN